MTAVETIYPPAKLADRATDASERIAELQTRLYQFRMAQSAIREEQALVEAQFVLNGIEGKNSEERAAHKVAGLHADPKWKSLADDLKRIEEGIGSTSVKLGAAERDFKLSLMCMRVQAGGQE